LVGSLLQLQHTTGATDGGGGRGSYCRVQALLSLWCECVRRSGARAGFITTAATGAGVWLLAAARAMARQRQRLSKPSWTEKHALSRGALDTPESHPFPKGAARTSRPVYHRAGRQTLLVQYGSASGRQYTEAYRVTPFSTTQLSCGLIRPVFLCAHLPSQAAFVCEPFRHLCVCGSLRGTACTAHYTGKLLAARRHALSLTTGSAGTGFGLVRFVLLCFFSLLPESSLRRLLARAMGCRHTARLTALSALAHYAAGCDRLQRAAQPGATPTRREASRSVVKEGGFACASRAARPGQDKPPPVVRLVLTTSRDTG